MNRTLCIGDIHGGYRALNQCLDRSNFSWGSDKLICLGDICDGWPEAKQCVDLLMCIPKLVLIAGNHDAWTLDWMKTGAMPGIWLTQGGLATIESYNYEVDEDHRRFLDSASKYYLDEKNRLFVHGGIDVNKNLSDQTLDDCMWDRSLISAAWSSRHLQGVFTTRYYEIYLGHTTISRYDKQLRPLSLRNIYALDTGAGWEGKLTIMDIDSKEYWQSDVVSELYPGLKGRR
jgi:serine/threonine protein phosphatase 1